MNEPIGAVSGGPGKQGLPPSPSKIILSASKYARTSDLTAISFQSVHVHIGMSTRVESIMDFEGSRLLYLPKCKNGLALQKSQNVLFKVKVSEKCEKLAQIV